MQPLAYFACRSLLGWLQFIERGERAFARKPPLLIATGAAHCWAVVYALFIAIHTRAMRYDGYHEGYTEHLPFWVSWSETLAVGSMVIWWFAGFTTAAIRIVDENAQGLPVDGRDVDVNIVFKLFRARRLHDCLEVAHTVSCVGLFVSIILLCFAMGLMKGVLTACEICLCLVSIGFALPHVVVAGRKLKSKSPKKEDVSFIFFPAAEAAAQEAASVGPQLSVILALADSPGHAYLWQNLTYFISAVTFVASVAACGRSPPKVGGIAVPPEMGEFIACMSLNAAASLAMVICLPSMNTWVLWLMFVLLVFAFIALLHEGWRKVVVDLLDPLLVIKSDVNKVRPGRPRDHFRRASWVMTVLCATVAMWDIVMHPVQEGLLETPPYLDHHEDGLPDLWNQDGMLMFRWRQHSDAALWGESKLLERMAKVLHVPRAILTTQAYLPLHRLLVFKVEGQDRRNRSPAYVHWKSLAMDTQGDLAKVVDSEFPTSLNVSLCLHLHDHVDGEQKQASLPGGQGEDYPQVLKEAVRTSPGGVGAYLQACHWWTQALDAFYKQANGTRGSGQSEHPSGSSQGLHHHDEAANDF